MTTITVIITTTTNITIIFMIIIVFNGRQGGTLPGFIRPDRGKEGQSTLPGIFSNYHLQECRRSLAIPLQCHILGGDPPPCNTGIIGI